jgi:hypothetical protein
MWETLRKTAVHLPHVTYGHDFSNKLFAENIRARAGASLDIALDLDANLRTRSTLGGGYIDAKRLADGAVHRLTSVEIDDKQVLERLNDVLERMDEEPKTWRLLVNLGPPCWFVVQPEYRSHHAYQCLTLRVVESLQDAPQDEGGEN